MGWSVAIPAITSLIGSFMNKKTTDNAAEAQNAQLLKEQTQAAEQTKLSNTAANSTTTVYAGGSAQTSADSGYAGNVIKKSKLNSSTISSGLGF